MPFVNSNKNHIVRKAYFIPTQEYSNAHAPPGYVA